MRPTWSDLVPELVAAAIWTLVLAAATGIVLLRADDLESAVHGTGVALVVWPIGIALVAGVGALRRLDDDVAAPREARAIGRPQAAAILAVALVVTAGVVVLG